VRPRCQGARALGPDAPFARRSFVWHKKLEKQILDGADVRDLGLKAERGRQKERMVRSTKPFSRSSNPRRSA